MLPTYREHTVAAKDSLDVYIEHRLLMQQRLRNQAEPTNDLNQFPKELMKRLYGLDATTAPIGILNVKSTFVRCPAAS